MGNSNIIKSCLENEKLKVKQSLYCERKYATFVYNIGKCMCLMIWARLSVYGSQWPVFLPNNQQYKQ